MIKEWDGAFSLDGNMCSNRSKAKQMILQRCKNGGKKQYGVLGIRIELI